jgi:2-(1,2-epoxy-1,2-dihydrophenyl)acetyl-CoA isomerase
MTAHRIAFSIEDGIARLTLDNAERRNAIDMAFVEAFADCASRCDDSSVKAVLISANGKYFSVGGDLADFVAHAHDIENHVRTMAQIFHAAIELLYNSPAPVVLALRGMAAGGGFSLVCGADVVIAARSARLTSAYTRTGLTPDGGLTYFLERSVGYRKAFEIMTFNPVMSAEEAVQLGIVNQVVDDDALDAAANAAARSIAQNPSSASLRLKQLMRGSDMALGERLQREAIEIARQAAMPETLDSLRLFLGDASRKPRNG